MEINYAKRILSCLSVMAFLTPAFGSVIPLENFQPVIVAGDPSGTPPDSPANRVDPNTTTSSWAGVGSLQLFVPSVGTFICSATPIDSTHLVTAAHCLDLVGSDGVIDVTPGNVTFNLNFGGNLTHQITASSLAIHPNYTGFNNPSINDDIAVITLSSPLPTGAPTYPLYTTPFSAGLTLSLVGYGLSGDGVNGYTVGASFTVKRVGQNNADGFILDDEGGGLAEVFFFDFDGGTAPNFTGGTTLGNTSETTLGGGDSGGPAFVFDSGAWRLAGVNTFTASFTGGPSAPFFGSAGGGMIVPTYASWVQSVIGVPEPSIGLLLLYGFVLLRDRRTCR